MDNTERVPKPEQQHNQNPSDAKPDATPPAVNEDSSPEANATEISNNQHTPEQLPIKTETSATTPKQTIDLTRDRNDITSDGASHQLANKTPSLIQPELAPASEQYHSFDTNFRLTSVTQLTNNNDNQSLSTNSFQPLNITGQSLTVIRYNTLNNLFEKDENLFSPENLLTPDNGQVIIANTTIIPLSFNLDNLSINENLAANTFIANFSANHHVGIVVFQLLDNQAEFNIINNQLFSQVTFNHETNATYEIRVRASDSDNNQTESVFVIQIDNTNDAPTISGLATQTFTEASNSIAVIALAPTITLTDEDVSSYLNAQLSVSINGHDLSEIISMTNAAAAVNGNVQRQGSAVQYYQEQWITIGNIDGTNTGNGTTLTILFNNDATATRVKAVIEALTYSDQDFDLVQGATRTVNILLNDGQGGDTGTHSFTININSSANNFILTAGNDNFTTGSENDIFTSTNANWDLNNDIINAGDGTDTLTISDSGNLTFNHNLRFVEIIDLQASANVTINNTLFDHSSTNTIELQHGGFSLALDTNNVNIANSVIVAGTGIVSLGDQGNRVLSKAGVDTTINGGAQQDTIIGESGNDSLIGGYDGDTISGGNGNDIIYADGQYFSTSSIDNTALIWLDPSANNALTTSGNEVLTVTGKGPGAEVASAGGAGNRADLAAYEGFGGRIVLSFDGADYYNVSAFDLTQDYTFFTVSDNEGDSNGTIFHTTGDVNGVIAHTTGGATFFQTPSAYGNFIAGTGNDPAIANYIYSNSGDFASYYIDGALQGTLNDADVSAAQNGEVAVIGRHPSGVAYLTGYIGEIILFAGALTDGERQQVQEYLSMKFNIALDGQSFGADVLTGGGGADTFGWSDNSISNSTNLDRITDFTVNTDFIQLEFDSMIYLDDNLANNFDGVQNQLTWYDDGTHSYVAIDWGGDGSGTTGSDFLIRLDNISDYTTIDTADFTFHNVTGTAAADTLNGSALDNDIHGAGGDDTLAGNAGNDSLTGGYGGDTISGGSGDDTIYADGQYFSTSSIDNTALIWLDPSANNALTTSGNEVLTVTGKGPGAEVASAGGAGNRADLAAYGGFGGRIVLSFDGADYYNVSAFDLTQDYTFFTVSDNEGGGNSVIFHTVGDANGVIAHTTSGATFFQTPSAYGNFIAGTGNDPAIANYIYSNSGDFASYYIDGALQGTLNDADVSAAQNGEVAVIGRHPSGVAYLTGYIGEIILFAGALTDGERQQVQEYLSMKFNIALDGQSFGADVLTGGGGADTFGWSDNSISNSTNLDRITDFTVNTDFIKLEFDSMIYLDDNLANNFDGVQNQLTWYDDGTHSYVAIDWGGDGSGTTGSDFLIRLDNISDYTTIDTADFTFHNVTGTSNNDILNGTDLDNILNGAGGNDTIDGGAGADILDGGAGDDYLIYDSADLVVANAISGGSGDSDVYQILGSSINLDLTAVANDRIVDIERIDLTGSGDNTLTLDANDVLDISSTVNYLYIEGNVGDTVNLSGGGWSGASANDGPAPWSGQSYNMFSNGSAIVYIDEHITVV